MRSKIRYPLFERFCAERETLAGIDQHVLGFREETSAKAGFKPFAPSGRCGSLPNVQG